MPHCPRLAGHCTQTGDHWIHHGTLHAVPAPHQVGGTPIVDVRLEEYEDGVPLLVLGWGGDTASLSAGQALKLAGRLVGFAGRLIVEAARLVKARRTA
ncbi:DUF6907 domain-containing protein [Kitasatospora sp. NPDC054939]